MPTYTLHKIQSGNWDERKITTGLYLKELPDEIARQIKSRPTIAQIIFPSGEIIYNILKE